MANKEKHPKGTIDEIDQADSSMVPTCARASHLVGEYIKNHQEQVRRPAPGVDERTRAFILRFKNIPATPTNLERLRERVRLLNRRLSIANAPFRLRVT